MSRSNKQVKIYNFSIERLKVTKMCNMLGKNMSSSEHQHFEGKYFQYKIENFLTHQNYQNLKRDDF